MPEAVCRKRTALSVLFTCCPPGPLERKVSTSHSRSKSSSDSGILINVRNFLEVQRGWCDCTSLDYMSFTAAWVPSISSSSPRSLERSLQLRFRVLLHRPLYPKQKLQPPDDVRPAM